MPEVPGDVLTFGGASAVVVVLLQAIKAVWQPSPEAIGRYGPVLAIAVGVLVVVLFALVTPGAVIASAILTGLFAGAAAGGIYSVAKSGVNAALKR